LRADCRACVMEVSSHALEQKRVLGVEFDVAIFTNLTRDHLDYHGTMENYFAAKKKLFAALQDGTKKGAAVINIDDSYVARRAGRLEVVASKQPFGVYVDYAHTDDALKNVLTTLREITTGRLLLAFGCGGNRDAGKRARMGRIAAELADFTIITNDNPRKESP